MSTLCPKKFLTLATNSKFLNLIFVTGCRKTLIFWNFGRSNIQASANKDIYGHGLERWVWNIQASASKNIYGLERWVCSLTKHLDMKLICLRSLRKENYSFFIQRENNSILKSELVFCESTDQSTLLKTFGLICFLFNITWG